MLSPLAEISHNSTFEDDMAALDKEIQQLKQWGDNGSGDWELPGMDVLGPGRLHSTRYNSCGAQSCGVSVASSECSDEGDSRAPLIGMDSCLNSMLSDSTDPEDSWLPGFDWSGSDVEDVIPLNSQIKSETKSKPKSAPTSVLRQDIPASPRLPSVIPSQTISRLTPVKRTQPCLQEMLTKPSTPSNQPIHIKKTCDSSLDDNRPWSSLSFNEQIEVVEALTEVISQELGLREQLEIIQIINPTAAVSPTQTEFVIDLQCFNDVKLHRVREYVRQHMHRADVRSSAYPAASDDEDDQCSDESMDSLSPQDSGAVWVTGAAPALGRPRSARGKTKREQQRLRKVQRLQREKRAGSGLYLREEGYPPFRHNRQVVQEYRTMPAAPSRKNNSSGGEKAEKCRKVYGMEGRDQWCTQCKWKKACSRFKL